MINLLFNILKPEHKTNWLSQRFARWEQAKRDRQNHIYRINNKNDLFFPVAGAGEIDISNHCYSHTGRSFGFHFGVSWGSHGYCGGVLDREEAKRLADFIISEYNKVSQEQKDKEQKSLIDRDERLREYFETKS